MSAGAAQAGTEVQMTVTARNPDGTVNLRYIGTVRFTSTDSAFFPGTLFRYSYNGGGSDLGVHSFTVRFHTAGSHTITVADDMGATPTASPTVTVAETVLSATLAPASVQQGATGASLVVQATTTGGAVVSGWRGTVRLGASWNSVLSANWGAGVDPSGPSYTFTAADAGSHSFSPVFSYAGDQTATVTDAANAGRTVTSNLITVTNSPAATYAHEAAPSGALLADGSVAWAFLGSRGRLYARRNVGTLSEPAWRPGALVRDITAGTIGADSPSIIRFGTTLALFHTYPDASNLFQVWLVTSTDNGGTWSSSTKITSEVGHVGRVAAVVDGSTVRLFFSRQNTDGRLYQQTSIDLSTWSAKTTVSQGIGPLAGNATSNFGIAKQASGSWLLGWVGTSTVGEAPNAPAGSVDYPVVKVATSTDLTSWSAATELNQAYSQRWPSSVAVGQDPATATLYAVFDQFAGPQDYYLAQRTSTNGTSWASQTLVGYDRAAATNGGQGYTGRLPAWVAASTTCAWSVEVGGGSLLAYGHGEWNTPDAGKGLVALDCKSPAETFPMPYGDAPETLPQGGGVNPITGRFVAGGADLAVAAHAFPLAVGRSYNSYDAVAGHSGPFGYGWTWSYRARAVTLADGSVSVLEPSGRRSLFWKSGSTWTAAPGINATLAAAGGGYTLTSRDQRTLSFDSAGKLTAVADRNGNTLSLTYAGNNLTTITAPGGRALTVTTDGQGRITQVSGPLGLTATYTYDAAGNLATATDAAGSVARYSYDSRHQLTQVQDGNGKYPVNSTYGTLGRVTSQKLGGTQEPRSGSFTWLATVAYAYASQGYAGSYGGANGGANVVTDPRGTPLYAYFDAGLRLTRREVRQYDVRTGQWTVVQSKQWTYDANNNVTSSTDPNGRVSSATYDSRGNVLTTTADSGTGGLNLTTTFTYTATNDLLTVTDPLGHTSTSTYDSHGNRLASANALGQTATFAYDGVGQLTSATDATNRTTTYAYNTSGDPTGVTVPGPFTTTSAYDAAGRLTSTTDPLTHTTSYSYDGMGRTRTVTNALNQTTTFTYDAEGNRTRVTDALGRQTNYAYDARIRLTTVTDALGGVTTYTYDAGGNRTATTNALGRTWTATYDVLGRTLTEADPLGNTTSYTYDAAGTLTQVSKPTGITNRFVYDRVYRQTAIDLQNNGSLDIQYTYDTAGRRTSMIDGTGTTTSAYDNANRLLSVTAPVTGTVSYGYDAAGRTTTLTYPSIHQVQYGYEARGLLATVTDWTGGVTTYSYDAAGRRTRTALPNQVPLDRTYDTADRLLSLTQAIANGQGGTTTRGLTYSYDAVGNRTSLVDTATGSTSFTYDTLNRLTQVGYPNGDVTSYTYDAVGNRATQTTNGTATTYSYDTANRLTAAGTSSFTYDTAGNQLTDSSGGVTRTTGYDAQDRLTSFSNGSTSATYTYNGDGGRVATTVGPTTTRFTLGGLNGLAQVLAESTGTEYVYGHELIAQYVPGRVSSQIVYNGPDALGSPVQTTTNTGTAAGTRQYDAFGAVRAESGEGVGRGFTGEQVDSESGLVYLRERYYDPTTGRFLTQDPDPGHGREPMSQHQYAYAHNNPVRFTDQTGRSVYDNPLPDQDPDSPIAKVRKYGPMDPDECARFAPNPRACDRLFSADVAATSTQPIIIRCTSASRATKGGILTPALDFITDLECPTVMDFILAEWNFHVLESGLQPYPRPEDFERLLDVPDYCVACPVLVRLHSTTFPAGTRVQVNVTITTCLRESCAIYFKQFGPFRF